MKSLQEAYNSIYIQEEIIETIDVFECAYITLVENGMCEDDATEVVNYIYEHLDEIQELEQDLQEDLNENAAGRLGLTLLGGVAKLLNFLPKKKGVQRLLNMPKPKLPSQLPTMQSVVKKTPTPTGTPVQTSIFSKAGKLKDFSGGKVPFPGSGPAFLGPRPAAPSAQVARSTQAPGQMRIPGMSDRAQELRNVTGNPNLGLPGNTQGFAVTGGSNATRNKGIFRAQPQRTAPSLPQPPASPPAPKNNLAKVALPVGVAGATGLALSGGEGPKKSEDPRRPDGSLPPYTPPRPPADPEPPKKAVAPPTDHNFMSSSSVYTGDNLKRPAKELSAAAKDFDRAFAAARKEGKKEFTWRGKQYNTKYKGE